MSLIANRMGKIKPSPTLLMARKARELKAKNIDVISLSVGEPDFDTPDNIKQKAVDAIWAGQTKYTEIEGTKDLRNAIIAKLKRENGLDFEMDQIIASTGGKQVIYNVMMASLNHGDEVIIPAPYWVSYADIVALADGVSVIVPCPMEIEFKITPELLEKHITTKTKWLILNSPNNPTGAVYSKKELVALAEVLRKHPHVYIFSDDIYEHMIYSDEKFYTIAEIAPDLQERCFICNGVSKGYSMTGWRLGYGAGPKDLIKAVSMLQSQSTTSASSITQAAAVEALNGTQDFIPENSKNFKEKRDMAISMISAVGGLKCNIPDGAFYLFPECKQLFGKKTPSGEIIGNDNDLATYFLEHAHVAVVPGVAFGMEGYFRFSYATSKELITEACRRIKVAVEALN
jgi:aspartate aminotransferase